MKNHLFNMCRFVIGYVRRRRLDALRRRTHANGMWKITECPDFLKPDRQRPTEAGQERGPDPTNDLNPADNAISTKRVPAFIRDGDRVVCWGTRIVPS